MFDWLKRLIKGNENTHDGTSEMTGRIWLIGTPEFGNLGDHMISEMENYFIRQLFPNQGFSEITMTEYYDKIEHLENNINDQDIIFLHGGGNVGNLWPKSEYIRRDIFKRWKDNKKIIMPQSIYFTNDQEGEAELKNTIEAYDSKNILLVCREKSSYEFALRHFSCNVVLTPDLVMYGKDFTEVKKAVSRNGCILCFRKDKEKALSKVDEDQVKAYAIDQFENVAERDTVIDSVKRQDQKNVLDEYLGYLYGAELVITDRLHGMIFCALTGTPCVVFENSYHKITDSYEWIKELKYIELVRDLSELEDKIEQVLACLDRSYPIVDMRKKFDDLIQYCSKSRWQ